MPTTADGFRDGDHNKLEHHLSSYRRGREDKSPILIFISVQRLYNGTKCNKTMYYLAEPGLITAYCINKVHAVVDHGEAFYPEFPDVIKSIRALIETVHMNNPGHVTPLVTM